MIKVGGDKVAKGDFVMVIKSKFPFFEFYY